jgi:putative acetyltransferase
MAMIIRKYTPADTQQIMDLFYDTVHAINSQHYSAAQVAVWAPRDMNYHQWVRSLSRHHTYVAEVQGMIVGFGDFEDNGHLDRFYCHKDYQGVGVGTQLLAALEQAAKTQGISCLFTEASITARPFFEKRGFVLINEQQITFQGVTFTNYVMEKEL